MNEIVTRNEVRVDVDAAIENWKAYQKLCGKDGILDQSDYQKIWVKEKDPETGEYVYVEREFKKKSAWQKLGRAFNVDTEIVKRELTRTSTGYVKEAYYCVRATLPNGRSVESDALCDRTEKGKGNVSNHTIMTTAKTRATSRAISELIGAGEVSSEEMLSEYEILEEDDKILIENKNKDTETTAEDDVNESAETKNNDYIHKSAPKLIEDCIDALTARGMRITNNTVKTCIESRFSSQQEYDECMGFLESIDLEGAL